MNRIILTAAASALALAAAAGAPQGSRFPAKDATAAQAPFIVKPTSAEQLTAPFHKAPQKAKAHDVPFVEDFTSDANLGDWGVFDLNSDGYTWQYDANNGLVKFYTFYTSYANNNDWLSTPAINLGADDIYTLTFKVGSNCNRASIASEALRVTMGKQEDVTKHTTVLFADNDIRDFWNGHMRTVTVTLPVTEDGAYYIGFHCTSPSGGYAIYLDDISVEQNGSYEAPAAPSDFTVTPGARGALSATATLTAPATDAAGKALAELDAITLYRDGQMVDRVLNPAPGAQVTLRDASAPQGMRQYRAIAEANGLEGAKAETTVYVGVDTPLAVTNIVAKELADGSVALTWDAPLSANGGYVGDDVVAYTLVRYDTDADVELGTVSGTRSYTDRPAAETGKQGHVYYGVVASTNAGAAKEAISNSVFTGPAYTLPFAESFANLQLKASPWVMETIKSGVFPSRWQLVAMGSLPQCPPVDGDDGMLMLLSTIGYMNLYQGNEVRLATPAIDLSQAEHPQVSFYIFHFDTTVTESEYNDESGEYETVVTKYNEAVRLQISLDNGEYQDIPDSRVLLAANNNGWTKYTISLEPYKGAKKASIGICGYADGGGNIFVDQLLVEDKVDNDIAVESFLGPQRVAVGETANYVVNIINRGTSSTKNYTVDLCLDGATVLSQKGQGAAIFANGGEKTLRFAFTPTWEMSGTPHELTAVVRFDADQCEANNVSEPIALEVPSNGMPMVAQIEGNVDGGAVALTWDEPDFSDKPVATVDDMEGHTAFAISGIGGYTLVDNDKASATYGISGLMDYPNAGAAMAWQVFNPAAAGLDLELGFNRRWVPRSGSQFLIAWGAYDESGISNDDWLISPLLNGEEQVVAFYIKGVTLAYPERFRVLYSMDTKSISDFVKVAETTYYQPTSTWRRFSVRLPKGAKYFAIQCISADGFGLMVDDITYIPAGAPTTAFDFMGYDVYRDGQLITPEPVAEPTYVDTEAPEGAHVYTVACRYAQGVSSPSAPYVSPADKPSGVSDVAAAASAFTAAGGQGYVAVSGAQGTVEIYDVAGRLTARRAVDGSATFTLAPGAYVARCGAEAKTVIVR